MLFKCDTSLPNGTRQGVRTMTLVASSPVQRVAIATSFPQGCPRETDLCLSFPAKGKGLVILTEDSELCGLEMLGKSLFSDGTGISPGSLN